ncbi:MAG TPA: TRAM domain-containing protein [Polyangiaceae bacterium]|jgi:23S rRNA (uracil1939-C5)-methyltransferase
MASALEVTIASLAPGGDGVAHVELDGERRAVFVPHTAPGDVVRAEVDASRRPARGHLLEVLTAGPERVASACAWSLRCGGCDWMHLSLEAQGRAHVEHVRAALPPAWRDVPATHHAADAALAYRTRARLHVRCERGRVEVGMHEAGTHDPVAVDTCVVLDPAVEAARRRLGALVAGSRGRGDVQIALGAERRPVLEVRWDGEVAAACFGRLEQAVASGELAGARVFVGDASKPAVVGDPAPWVPGADGQPLRLAPGGFGQASERMNAALARHVASLVRPLGVERAVELYAGSGNLSVLLAREVRELALVESSREACDAARANLSARSLSARVVEADAGAYAWGATTRLVVLDPPRTGARAVAERLAASRVPHVVYVACDAQTLGRDLAVLAEGGASTYVARSIATFEMFPQTSHVETVVALERVRGARP